MASLDYLSDSEIRSKLAEFGHPVGPVTETTRKILIKKLKILMKHKSGVGNANRSLTGFSSDDSDGEQTENRRLSMPPPSSVITTRRKLVSRNSSPGVSAVPSGLKLSSSGVLGLNSTSPDIGGSRVFNSAPTSLRSSRFLTRKRTSANTSYNFDSGSDSDVTDLTPRSREVKPCISRNSSIGSGGGSKPSGPTYGTLSSYRSRLSTSPSTPGYETRSSSRGGKESPKKESRPFLSSFARRLTRRSTVDPRDIKESDAEETDESSRGNTLTTPRRVSQSSAWSRLLRQLQSSPLLDHLSKFQTSQVLSMALPIIAICFFTYLTLAYFRVTHRPSIESNKPTTTSSGNVYPICPEELDQDSKVNCIPRGELQLAVQLYKDVHLELRERAVRWFCDDTFQSEDNSVCMTEREVAQFLSARRTSAEPQELWRLELGVRNLALLLLSNPHWGVVLLRPSPGAPPPSPAVTPPPSLLALPSDLEQLSTLCFIASSVAAPWACVVATWFQRITRVVGVLLIVAGLGYSVYFLTHYYLQYRRARRQAVLELVERILRYVSNASSLDEAEGFVAVRHVHDALIPPQDRQAMSSIWLEATEFISEHESRVRSEVQRVWGEDALVWRWLGPPLATQATSGPQGQTPEPTPPAAEPENTLYPDLSDVRRSGGRFWQGEAFETSEGSMNSLACPPTQCLKIRHMFQQNKDYGPDWVVKVKDAIIEKCEGCRIVHLSVDTESKEGCVYVKCAINQDAGLAYRRLHGSWFDGALVTVKYLRLERYHERFPDSIPSETPLRPSNNLKLSLQGPVS